MGIIDGQAVDAANSNPAWLDANADDVALGKIGFENTDPQSGPWIANTQRLQNNIADTIGLNVSANFTAEADPNGKTYSAPPNTINDGDTHKTALRKLAEKFSPTIGHAHTGASGDGPQISAATLADVPLQGYFRQGLNLTAVTGGSVDVSTELTGYFPSSGVTSIGVVVDAPYNQVILRNTSNDSFEDGSGNLVYGRITYDSLVWTLTFYVDIAGVETAYTFSTPVDIKWYFQELLNPMVNPPIYSELAIIPSDNPTEDVATATTGLQGKVLLSSSAPSAIASTGSAGTANATVANADHTHEGTHSVGVDGDPHSLLGDVKLQAGNNITLTTDLINNRIEIAAENSGIAAQEVPAGIVNGTNTIFGPLSYVPTSPESIAVFRDGIIVDKAEWSLSGLSIVFTSPPALGQQIYVFYLTNGTVSPPPVFSNILKTEYRTITAGEETAKSLTLAHLPVAPTEVALDWEGVAQFYTSDFVVSGTTLSWSGTALDGLVTAGDRMRIIYVY